MNTSIIVATAKNRAIGKDNDLLWHLPDDMAFFKEITKGHCIITGRKNYESIPPKYRPLPNRTNILVTRNKDYHESGVIICHSLQEAINVGKKHENDELFIIGGGQIYAEALNLCDKIYLTEVNASFEDADVYFPLIDDSWTEISRTPHPADERHKYSFDFVELVRKL